MINILNNISETISSNLSGVMSFVTSISSLGVSLTGLSKSVIMRQQYSFANKLPTTTLEEGAEISEHIINGPLMIEQVFTVAGITSGLGGYAKTTLTLQGLLSLRKSKSLLTIVTYNGFFRNMAIESLTVLQELADSLICSIRFKEMTFDSSSDYKVETRPAIKSLSSKLNKSAEGATAGAIVSPSKAFFPIPAEVRADEARLSKANKGYIYTGARN